MQDYNDWYFTILYNLKFENAKISSMQKNYLVKSN